MQKQHIYLLITILVMTMASCSKEDSETIQEPVKSSAKQITGFVLRAEDNAAITEDVTAVINETNKTISATVANGTDIKALTPMILISDKAAVNESGAKDFSSPVDYVVTAEDGTSATYTVTVGIALNSTKEILSFAFRKEDNQLYGDETITTIIDDANKTITATVSYSANAALLVPSIEVSPNASVSPDVAQDFSTPVAYTVTAEDGTTTEYQVTLEITFTDRDALIAIYNANPNNTLGWDLNDPEIENWVGVDLNNEGRVTVLGISSRLLITIPPEIGKLAHLETLFANNNNFTDVPQEFQELSNIVVLYLNNNDFTSVPEEVCQLSNLKILALSSLNLSSLPPEIGNLSQLTTLYLNDNRLTALPDELKQVSVLKILDLSYNNFTSFPTILFQIPSLTNLRLDNNQLTAISSQIELLTNLKDLRLNDNSIRFVPSNISKLTALKKLYLENNDIASISSSIGLLSNLEELTFKNNDLGSIPLEIKNLTNLKTLDLTINPELFAISQAICDLVNTGTDVRLDNQTTCQ
ncbi:hypothetical protein HZY62_02050 [Maribacter polysiphoniae]|uniref:Leucine rich repeat (LRR) protein n=1 Tax=Maribacter polysiphoniae TaxID=429344 RepID=A0A316E2L8_9FLAO|nr:hypothetical protein [Maribacter polysiphoniae]MBD1259355.1 hypothetical protein [Maribacter polysiphoniae]PWK24917.1 leucine rich repeat (LRR) protein [Maribacter polysiphoniae]